MQELHVRNIVKNVKGNAIILLVIDVHVHVEMGFAIKNVSATEIRHTYLIPKDISKQFGNFLLTIDTL